ncbi:MAG: sodium:alanine symporter family protein [Rhodospirillaceae bacterium]|nr:sodium:alanine symporter family protein [Rhodospirillaceae bacterium]
METFSSLIGAASDIAFGPVTIILILGTGVYLTIGLRFLPWIRLWGGLRQVYDPRLMFKKDKGGEFSPRDGLMTALAGMVGIGKIVGVATAIHMGGPGALFWMWMTAFVGMGTRYAEAYLAVTYREVTPQGTILAGPMYYIKHGLGQAWVWLGGVYAVCACIQAFGPSAQSNTIAEVLNTNFGIPFWGAQIILILSILSVLVGGLKRLATTSDALVPLMVGVYLLAGIAVLIVNASAIPGALFEIITSAFTGEAAVGGFAGAGIIEAIRYGVARGIFANEAGVGSAAIAHGTAHSTDAVEQGVLGSVGVFVDTIIVCSITGLVIVVTGVWKTGETGATLAVMAFDNAIPGLGGPVVAFSVVLFGYSTLLAWGLYGSRALAYLFGEKALKPARVIYAFTVSSGAVLTVDMVWQFIDLSFAMMAAPNLIALILLGPKVFRGTREALARASNEKP